MKIDRLKDTNGQWYLIDNGNIKIEPNVYLCSSIILENDFFKIEFGDNHNFIFEKGETLYLGKNLVERFITIEKEEENEKV